MVRHQILGKLQKGHELLDAVIRPRQAGQHAPADWVSSQFEHLWWRNEQTVHHFLQSHLHQINLIYLSKLYQRLLRKTSKESSDSNEGVGTFCLLLSISILSRSWNGQEKEVSYAIRLITSPLPFHIHPPPRSP